MRKILKPLFVIVIFVVLVLCSVWLKIYLNLSDPSFIALVIVSAIFSVLLANLDNLKSISFRKGELILQEVKDCEENMKELASATLELVVASTDASIVTADYDNDRYEKAVEKVKSLIAKT
ncbi:hypothetical protein C2F68_RS23135 [Vibrio parahaemolyticus]|uniref:hypothetical protein n=1 Tax=Vibrio rotiferianus TaxID=190895 RepID=UPI001EB59C27|nr:hypothetical protein [Vibrio parahaemolyticus]